MGKDDFRYEHASINQGSTQNKKGGSKLKALRL